MGLKVERPVELDTSENRDGSVHTSIVGEMLALPDAQMFNNSLLNDLTIK